MNKIFMLLGLYTALLYVIGALVCTAVFADHIPAPNLPASERPYSIENYQWKCGQATWYEFNEWLIIAINGKRLLVSRKNSLDVWLDRDQDGHLDEFWKDGGFEQNYKNVCDAIKKQ